MKSCIWAALLGGAVVVLVVVGGVVVDVDEVVDELEVCVVEGETVWVLVLVEVTVVVVPGVGALLANPPDSA
jgi:hypothetical protein